MASSITVKRGKFDTLCGQIQLYFLEFSMAHRTGTWNADMKLYFIPLGMPSAGLALPL